MTLPPVEHERLAPIVGQLAAHELINDTAIPRLDAYRPGRAFENVKRY